MTRLSFILPSLALMFSCATPADLRSAGLPGISNIPMCLAKPIYSGCEWASSLDAMIVGRISGVRAVTSPAMRAGTDEVFEASECSSIGVALVLDIEVVSTLAGSTPKTLTVMMGYYTVSNFEPTPYLDKNNNVAWLDEMVETSTALEVGSVIGLPLREIAGQGGWTPGHHPLFGFFGPDDEEPVFGLQTGGIEQCTTYGSDLTGLTLARVADLLASCDASAKSRGKEIRSEDELLTQSPLHHYAAFCAVSDDP